MKTRAAVLRKAGTPWEITELELDPPKANEVLIQMEAAGLCHSDEHIRSRGMARLPLVGGHEGAGVVMETGPGVTRVKVGDRVSCSYIPVCGKCRYCSTGKQNLCDAGKWAGVGCLQDETFRFHRSGEDFGGMCVVGSFAEYSVLSEWSCVKVEDCDHRRRVLRDGAARPHPDDPQLVARGPHQTQRAHYQDLYAR
jgi:S-(hydroxymethyl)glutathione dehydrogenase/alcohol dehydrogenase